MPDLQRFPWNFNLIKNLEAIVVYLTRKLFIISVNFFIACLKTSNAQVTFTENQFKETKKVKSNSHTWSDKAFKGTVFNRELLSLYREGHLKLRLLSL